MPPKLMNKDQNLWKRACSRVLINGGPTTGKTQSLLTFPAPRHIMVAPGEQGISTLKPDDDTKIYYWEVDLKAPQIMWAQEWAAWKQLTLEILAGKHGECNTFAWDGIHKVYEMVQKANGYDVERMVTEENYSKIFALFHSQFFELFDTVCASPVPYFAATVWDGLEPVEGSKKDTEVYPLLPGRAAKDIIGKFPFVIHTKVRAGGFNEDGTQQMDYRWELKPTGRMKAAGMHVPKDIAAKFPAECEPDWSVVQKILDEG